MNVNSTDKRILFVGLNTIDIQFKVDEFPNENTKVKALQNAIHVGGPATNAAVACAHLGSKTDLFTPIGLHSLTDFIHDDLHKHRVNIIDPIQGSIGQPIFASIITSSNNGGRTAISYHPDKKTHANTDFNINFNKNSLVLFDGFYPQYAIPMAKKARGNGVTTVFDGGSWKPGLDELLNYIDIAICSNDFSVPDGTTPETVFSYLKRKGIWRAAITRGEKSILFQERDNTGEIQTEPIDAIDTLGAGDFFHGAFCHYYGTGLSFTDSLEQASKLAARTCLSFSTREWMVK